MKRMVGASITLLCLVFCFSAIVVADAGNLIGKWSLVNGGEGAGQIVEYRQDGTALLSLGSISVLYTYKTMGKDELEITSNSGKSTIYRFSISNDQLHLVPLSGNSAHKPPLTYIRLPS